jgi:pimeloyl-ACP methyl ester carboxylesterase
LFFRQVPLLVRASYRVATFALRSDAASMETLIEDLGRVIDAVAPETRRAIVVGESFGGALAMSFALARPQQVGALVVVNSFPTCAHAVSRRGPGSLGTGGQAGAVHGRARAERDAAGAAPASARLPDCAGRRPCRHSRDVAREGLRAATLVG